MRASGIGGTGARTGRRRGWAPRDLGARRFIDLCADVGVTTVSNKISAWTDQAPTPHSASMSNATFRPALTVNAQNGRPVATFDGADDWMDMGTITLAATDLLIVAAMNPSNTAATQILLDSQAGRLIVSPNATDTTKVGLFDGVWQNLAAVASGFQILAWEFRAGVSKIYRNGAAVGSPGTYAQPALGGLASLGASFVGSNVYGGTLGHLVVVSSPTDSDRRQLTKYLGSRYAVALV